MCGSDVFLGFLAILFPPIAVWVKRGICSADSLINIALCCLGFLPGLLHAWYIIAVTPDPTYIQLEDTERGQGGHVTYYYVQTQGQPKYGTVNSTPNSQFPGSQQGGQPSHAPSGSAPAPAPAAGSSSNEAADAAPPPSYQQAVGDNKVQRP